jgi:hypothetical protein
MQLQKLLLQKECRGAAASDADARAAMGEEGRRRIWSVDGPTSVCDATALAGILWGERAIRVMLVSFWDCGDMLKNANM